jgi:hypothetical protein
MRIAANPRRPLVLAIALLAAIDPRTADAGRRQPPSAIDKGELT